MPTYVTKAELAEAKQKIDKRITDLVARLTSEEGQRADADLRLAEAIEALGTEPPEPLPDPPPASKFAPDIFYGDAFSKFSQKSGGSLYQPTNGGLAYVAGPDGKGWIEFNVTATTGTDITDNPRAEMIGPGFGAGEEWWQGGAVWLPEPWPTFPSGQWMNLQQITPGSGSPAISITQYDRKLVWNRNADGGWGNVWTRLLDGLTGRPLPFLIHTRLPTKSGGLADVEMWLNGEKVCETTAKVNIPSDGVHPYIQLYRHKALPTLKVFHKPLAIGSRRELVEYV